MTDSVDPAQAWSAVAEAWDANVDYVDGHGEPRTECLLVPAASWVPGEPHAVA